MGLSLSHGGNLTHGHQSDTKKISASLFFFEYKPYYVNELTGLIDYEGLEKIALEFKPNMIIYGVLGSPRDKRYKRFGEICD
jgi:glycine hydroxymethyltransferase